ncbi:MAG: DUF4136 domain-containing protein [Runella sp.]
MLRTHVISALLMGALVSSCATVNVDKSAKINFDNYRKFSFAQPELAGQVQNPLLHNGITNQNIEQAISDEMAKKGIVRDDQNPDFLIMYHEFFQNKTQRVANYTYGYGNWGFGPIRYGFRGRIYPVSYAYYYNPWGGYHTEHYTDGTLIVDVIDAKTNQLLWRGSIENPVNNPARLSRQFAREAHQILTKYPNLQS